MKNNKVNLLLLEKKGEVHSWAKIEQENANFMFKSN